MNPVLLAKKAAKDLARKKSIQLKKALEEVAQTNGHADWKSYKSSIDTFWYPMPSPFLTNWFVTHKEASVYRAQYRGYLLTYKGQFLVVSREYIADLGYDPDAQVWSEIDFDVSSAEALDRFHKYATLVYK